MALEKWRRIEREVNRLHVLTGIAVLTLAFFAYLYVCQMGVGPAYLCVH
jgi:hypothetical protein